MQKWQCHLGPAVLDQSSISCRKGKSRERPKDPRAAPPGKGAPPR